MVLEQVKDNAELTKYNSWEKTAQESFLFLILVWLGMLGSLLALARKQTRPGGDSVTRVAGKRNKFELDCEMSK